MRDEGVYGEFGDADALISAMRALKSSEFPPVDAYTPFPIDAVAEILASRDTRRALPISQSFLRMTRL